MPLRRSMAVVALLVVPACTSPCSDSALLGSAGAGSPLGSIPQLPARARSARTAPKAGQARCFAHVRDRRLRARSSSNDDAAGLRARRTCRARTSMPATGGAGKTVALVDAQDDPERRERPRRSTAPSIGLPPCTTANGCFHKVDQSGEQSSYPAADSGLGRRDLARPRHGQRHLPDVQHPARRGQQRRHVATSAPA